MSRLTDQRAPAPFGGYPYIVVRIGHTPLRHIAVVPADWPRERIVDLARAQAEANRLEAAACFGPQDAVYLTPGDSDVTTGAAPTGFPVIGRLHPAQQIPDSPELAARGASLRAYARAHRGRGYLVGDGLEDGVPATADDRTRFGRLGPGGLPPGMSRCRTCGQATGQCLNNDADQVVWCRCGCENDNRCAHCGQPLAAQRLSAWHWDDTTGQPWYLAAYAGLAHRCPDDSGKSP